MHALSPVDLIPCTICYSSTIFKKQLPPLTWPISCTITCYLAKFKVLWIILVDEPCEMGCKDEMSFCTNFNDRPTELFRSCSASGDENARDEYKWVSILIPLAWVTLGNFGPFYLEIYSIRSYTYEAATENFKEIAWKITFLITQLHNLY